MGRDDATPNSAATSTPTELPVRNERVTLTAAWLNGLAVAVFAVGGFAPFIAATIAPTPSAANGLRIASQSVFVVIGLCWVASAVLHVFARKSLGKLIALRTPSFFSFSSYRSAH